MYTKIIEVPDPSGRFILNCLNYIALILKDRWHPSVLYEDLPCAALVQYMRHDTMHVLRCFTECVMPALNRTRYELQYEGLSHL